MNTLALQYVIIALLQWFNNIIKYLASICVRLYNNIDLSWLQPLSADSAWRATRSAPIDSIARKRKYSGR